MAWNIFQYPFESDEWSGWQWITGKDSSSDVDLNEFIRKRNSYYHYLISNNVAASFENDKSTLIPKKYWLGEKDSRHNTLGSISSHKMSFRNNNTTFCTGYLTISTYGKKLFEKHKNGICKSTKDFEQLLFDFVIPPFRKIIEAELGFLYMRHLHRREQENKK